MDDYRSQGADIRERDVPEPGLIGSHPYSQTDVRNRAKAASAMRTEQPLTLPPMYEIAERLNTLIEQVRREMGGMSEVLNDHSDRVHGGRPVGADGPSPTATAQSHEYDGALGQVWASLDGLEGCFAAHSQQMANAVSRATTLA